MMLYGEKAKVSFGDGRVNNNIKEGLIDKRIKLPKG